MPDDQDCYGIDLSKIDMSALSPAEWEALKREVIRRARAERARAMRAFVKWLWFRWRRGQFEFDPASPGCNHVAPVGRPGHIAGGMIEPRRD